MKKILFCITILCLLFACAACRTTEAPPQDTSVNETVDSTARDNTEPPTHEHIAIIDEGYAATCTATGLTDGSHCSVCGEIITSQLILAKEKHTAVIDEGYAAT